MTTPAWPRATGSGSRRGWIAWSGGAAPGRERDPDAISSRNNHRYLSDSVTMAWGILRGDDDGFRAGIERYLAALGQMRPDGSLPLETARGSRALSYQRHAITSLVAIAEMAAAQGYDLYAIEGPEGQSIHRAIGFLLDGIDQTSLVWPYAAGERQLGLLSQLQGAGPGLHDRARPWAALHGLDRGLPRPLPGQRACAAARARALAEFGPAEPPLIDDYSGGNMSCFFALPDEIEESS